MILYPLACMVFGAVVGGTLVWILLRAELKRLRNTVPTALGADVLAIRNRVRGLRDMFGTEREIVVPMPEDLEINAQVDADIAAGRSPF